MQIHEPLNGNVLHPAMAIAQAFYLKGQHQFGNFYRNRFTHSAGMAHQQVVLQLLGLCRINGYILQVAEACINAVIRLWVYFQFFIEVKPAFFNGFPCLVGNGNILFVL